MPELVPDITTDFETGLDGWTTDVGTQEHLAEAGNPGGALLGVEGGSGVWTFIAPDAYLTTAGDYYGGTLSFDLRQSIDTSQFDDSDVILTGNGMSLHIDAGANPGLDWTHFSVLLALGGGWKVSSLTGRIATEAEIRGVLDNLESLEIRGEFVEGTTGDESLLDNVVLSGPGDAALPFYGTQLQSTFDSSTEGWSFIADVAEFYWSPTGGNPDGYLHAVDYTTGQVWYYVASSEYLGDRSAFSGGTLSFDLFQSRTDSQFVSDDVVIQASNGDQITWNMAANPGTDWTHYDIALDESAGWMFGAVAATQSQIDAILGDVSQMRVRGEFVSGSDYGGLDNFMLEAAGANVRVFYSASSGGLQSNHDALADAFASALDGQYIRVDAQPSDFQTPIVATSDGLTLYAADALETTLTLGVGVVSFTQTGLADLEVIGNDGNNRITSGVANDVLHGGDGSDTINGSVGNDVINGGATAADLRDVIYGGDGNDLLDGGYGNDELRGDAGMDTITGGFGVDDIFGGDGDDQLTGQAWSDLIFGGAGADFINGGFGYDRVNGGADADRFFHIGVFDHGSDWIQDYTAADGDVLQFGQAGDVSQFQVNFTETASAGATGVEEAFVIYRPTGQILWALVDGQAQSEINLLMGGVTYDLLA